MNGLNIQNHFSITSSSEVNQICQPILKDIGITYFNYLKIHEDGSRDLLTSNGAWINHFYKEALYKSTGVIDIEYLLPKGYFLWSELNNQDAVYQHGREYFNIDNGISFVIKQGQKTKLFIFASTPNNDKINNYYIRNLDLLTRFILYFQDAGSKLIKQAAENRIILPTRQKVDNSRINTINVSNKVRENFYRNTKIKKFYISPKSDDVYLSRREIECLQLLVDGFSAKEIAMVLRISHRTVEYHIEHTKAKLGCRNKSDLIHTALEVNIKNIL